MVHQYKNNGYNIILDVNSGAVHVVDDIVYDVIEEYNKNEDADGRFTGTDKDSLAEKFASKYSRDDVYEVCDEIEELTEQGRLFTRDIYEPYIDSFKDRPTVVKALCLHIAHDCNLA